MKKLFYVAAVVALALGAGVWMSSSSDRAITPEVSLRELSEPQSVRNTDSSANANDGTKIRADKNNTESREGGEPQDSDQALLGQLTSVDAVEKIIAPNGTALKLSGVEKLMRAGKFDEAMSAYALHTDTASERVEDTYRQMLYSMGGTYSGHVTVEGIECSAKFCLAKVRGLTEDAVASYEEQFRQAGSPEIVKDGMGLPVYAFGSFPSTESDGAISDRMIFAITEGGSGVEI